jgi:peptide/nickel transport system permease protein
VDERQLDPTLSSRSQQAVLRAHDEERNPAWFYVTYLQHMLAGNFGFSTSLSRPIRELLAERAPATVDLMVSGVAGAWLLALLFAVPPITSRMPSLAALFSMLSGVSACLPAAGIALVLYRFGASAKWMIPVILFPRLYQYAGNLLRQGYAMPHVLLARAKGLSGTRIFFQHVVPPARGQLIALAAVSINMAFGAAVAVEAICDLPGLGQLAWKAALSRDLPVLVVLTMIIALSTQFSNLVADALSPISRSQA